MRNILTIAGRDLKGFFLSPMAYIIFAVFIFINSLMFVNIISYFLGQSMMSQMRHGMAPGFTEMVVRPLWGNMNIILLFLGPAITMKLLSEEQKQQTIQLHYTSPVRIGELTIGKFLSAISFVGIMLAVTFIYPIFMMMMTAEGSSIPFGSIIGSYMGLFLAVGCYISIGLFFSSLTENQIIALIVGFLVSLGFWLIYWGSQTTSGVLAEFFAYVSIIDHFNNFSKGLIESSDVIYFFSFIGFWLFCTYLVLESKRWR